MAESRRDAREPMSKVDTAWLRMESPTNLMMITSVLMFAGTLELKKLRRLLESRFLAFRRFRQKAVDTASGAFWQTDTDFDIDWHVQLAALPGQGRQDRAGEIRQRTCLDAARSRAAAMAIPV